MVFPDLRANVGISMPFDGSNPMYCFINLVWTALGVPGPTITLAKGKSSSNWDVSMITNCQLISESKLSMSWTYSLKFILTTSEAGLSSRQVRTLSSPRIATTGVSFTALTVAL